MRPSLSIALGFVALSVSAAAAAPISLQVQYLTADRVYIDGGSRFGLAPGDRLQVVRDQEIAATLEVVYAATHSASCRIVDGTTELRAGDTVVWDAPMAPQPRLAARVQPALGPQQARVGVQVSQTSTPQAPPTPPLPRVPNTTRSQPGQRVLRSSVSGSLVLDWEQFTDDSGFGRDFDRTAARLSLRGRNLGGLPLQFRLRSSTRSLDRLVRSDGSSSITETRNRLYEMSLAYEPPEGRFALRLGRLRLGRYAGTGTIDGVSAETRLGRVFRLGVFGGSRSDISDFGFDGDRTTYGVTTRWSTSAPGRIREFLVAGVREDGVLDVSREYVAVQTRLSGGRWSLYQRAEIDFNNGWREDLTGSASQLSTLFVNASSRLSARSRFSLSYSRFERYRTEETRFVPEELFDDSQRQGLRARLQIGRSRGLNLTLSAGLRERDGDDATSAGAGLSHNNLFGKRFSLGLNVLTFSNRSSDGMTAILRAAKRLRGGHRVSLTAGFRTLDELIRDGDRRETQWFRLGGWFELPGNLFARAELEVSSGDDLEGQRVLVGLGYRI